MIESYVILVLYYQEKMTPKIQIIIQYFVFSIIREENS